MNAVEFIAALTAFVTVLAGFVAAVRHAASVVAPLLGRRDLAVTVVADASHDVEAQAFVARLRKLGYRKVERTRIPHAVRSHAAAVVVWRPSQTQVEPIVKTVQDHAPDSVVLVLSADRLPIMPSDRVLLSNSRVRLLGDLAAVAEGGDL